MRRPSPRVLFGLGAPLLVVLVLLLAWAVDSATASNKVPRNVALAGRDIGRLPPDRLTEVIDDVATQYLVTEVEIRTSEATFNVPAGDLGLRLDKDATKRNALKLDDDVSLWRRPFDWLGSFFDERDAPLSFTLDERAMTAALASTAGDAAATEPSLVASSNAITMISGSPGSRISAEGVAGQLLARARSGELPLVVNTKVEETQPIVPDAEVRALAESLTRSTEPGLTVKAGDQEVLIPAGTVRSWIGSRVAAGEVEVTVDTAAAMAAIESTISVPSEPTDARITLEGGSPTVIPSVPGQTCCAEGSADRVLFTVLAGSPSVELELDLVQPDFTTADAEALGVREPVGTTVQWNGQAQVRSFTTYHASKQIPSQHNRVANIQRMADIVRGTLVKPGETFSINAVVGRRTTEKGFLPAGAIANGVHVEEVGGGVSQFATTMFNAAFFAGLPFGEYQAHSEHFERYPFGREATMGWEHPDLQWTNNTPYGILVWTSYTDTSITVTLWSTQHAWGEQTGQTTGRSGNCTTVTTERTIHHPDGSTKVDTVAARYRDRGATRC